MEEIRTHDNVQTTLHQNNQGIIVKKHEYLNRHHPYVNKESPLTKGEESFKINY